MQEHISAALVAVIGFFFFFLTVTAGFFTAAALVLPFALLLPEGLLAYVLPPDVLLVLLPLPDLDPVPLCCLCALLLLLPDELPA
jgi:hypothetical protein